MSKSPALEVSCDDGVSLTDDLRVEIERKEKIAAMSGGAGIGSAIAASIGIALAAGPIITVLAALAGVVAGALVSGKLAPEPR